jgi:hypothetical protein
MLSVASIVIARCGICPEEIKEHEVVYDLLLNDADSNETFCGYACIGLQLIAVPKARMKIFLFGMFFKEFPRSRPVLHGFG